MYAIITIIIISLIIISSALKVLREYERAVIFRLGRLIAAKGPGIIVIIPFIDQMVRVDLRTLTMDVPKQEIITRDNVPVKVNAVVYFRVFKPEAAVTQVENYIAATSQLAQTSLRSILGQSELDELLSQREKINKELQNILDEATDPWGVKVSIVEVKEVEIPVEMQRAMAHQAEAERDRRAKVINAEGEFQASQRLVEAAKIMEQYPYALQLRYLQTLGEIAAEKNSTILFPIPIDLFQPFFKLISDKMK